MRTIDDSVWGEAMNDPSWIRFITARHPLARKDDEFLNLRKYLNFLRDVIPFYSKLESKFSSNSRLYSGWNRNMRRGGPMAATLYKSMRLRYFVKEEDSEHIISWKDFLKFMSVAAKQYPKLINTHFVPIYSKCGICMRQYDYIIKKS